LWERTARTEILEQSTSAPRILSADVADAIEALVGPRVAARKAAFGKDRYQARFCPRKPQAPGACRTVVATLDDDCERGG